jgi:hypothetical protein
MARQYKACLSKVLGSSPPVAFLDQLVDWALTAKDEIFAPNSNFDIYSSVRPQLGPYGFIGHRKAVMLEVLRVLAGRESNWNWNQGVDGGKKVKNNSHNEEAGAFQCSADSMAQDQSLTDLVQATFGATDDATFIAGIKSNHAFAVEYTARLLRFTVSHHGPILHHHIHNDVSKAAVKEFRNHIEQIGDFNPPPAGIRYA